MNNVPAYQRRFTHAKLLEHLHYDPETGLFSWKIAPRFKPYLLGESAGSADHEGYILVKFLQVTIRANRLAWFYMKGVWPTHEIDHRNRVRNDNRWPNLRELTRKENTHNVAPPFNKTNFPGVMKRGDSFTAKIKIAGKALHLGTFTTAEEAGERYATARRVLYPHSNIEHDDPDWRDGVPCDPDVIPF